METRTKSLIGLHIAIALIGASGLFAKLVSASAIFFVFGRVLFAAITLGLIIAWRHKVLGRKITLPRSVKDCVALSVIGILLTIHWIAFFHGIQLSSVAIGVLTLMTFPVFVTILEPILSKTRFRFADIISIILCCIGVITIVPYDPATVSGPRPFEGAIWGIVAGISYAFILLMHKRYITAYSATQLNFYQCVVVMIVLLPVTLWMGEEISSLDWAYVMVHGTVFTALAFTLYVATAKHLTAQVISISSMLEVVYGIILAWLLLGEGIEPRMIAGGALIVISAYIALKKSENKTEQE